MKIKLKSNKRNRVRSISANYTFRAPPNNRFSVFQPGGFYRMYHRVEAEKMKRSHYWVRLMVIAEKTYKKREFQEFQEESEPLKTHIEEGISKVEIKESDGELIKEIPDLLQ